ncbi:Altered inheritance of mitochondria protein 6 [Elasticomyces elasticus]|nr:Altered inheritance of mitochondria protein 6 [Elasticomyces elasticus]
MEVSGLAKGTFTLDDSSDERSVSSNYHSDMDVEASNYSLGTARLSIAHRLRSVLGMTSRRRKNGNGAEPATKGDPQAPLPRREPRRFRRTDVVRFATRALIAAPFLVLMLFGVLHIMHAVVGPTRLFWDVEVMDDFLPDWGMPGHVGEGLAKYPTDATRDVIPIRCHSHNDYWRHIPLFDALHWGCTGVEADVWLFDEELYVGHNLASLTPNRTFESLYVNPLVDLLEKMNPHTKFANISGHGVFDVDGSQTLVLLVDFKTNGNELFPVVSRQLEALRSKDYLSYWNGTQLNKRAVTVVGTGNTPFDLVIADTDYRDIFFDAPLDQMWESSGSVAMRDDDNDNDLGFALSELEADVASPGQGKVGTAGQSVDAFNTTNSYYASVSFTHSIGFVWRGHLSSKQMETIRGQIRGAHARGLKVRYWDTPSWPVSVRNHVWHVLMKEGADMLNVDDLHAASVDQWKARVHGWW